MNALFASTLRKLREDSGLSQKGPGRRLFVNHFTIARRESGSRSAAEKTFYQAGSCALCLGCGLPTSS